MHTFLHMHPTEAMFQARTMAAALLSRVVPAGAIDASKDMAPLLRLLDLSSNSRSGDANEERVSAINKMVFVGRKSVEGFARTPSCWHVSGESSTGVSPMELFDGFFGCGPRERCVQPRRQALAARRGHATSRLCELVRRTQLLSQLLVCFFRTVCLPRQM